MKELSIEDKAKRYDEAIERAKSKIKNDKDHVLYEYDILDIFPELKESEDEMIRKKLITFFQRFPYTNLYDANLNVKDVLAWLEKQGEQKPIDKVEPNFNFKVGQWIVATGKCVYLIAQIDGFNVTLVDVNGNEYVFDTSSLEDAHLWTIDDAKDGDVLVASDGSIFLFAGVVDSACKYYVALTTDNHIKINKEEKGGYWETSRAVYPATKAQRDLLFSKMREEGYEWDAEKK